jgi:hypothetical protein
MIYDGSPPKWLLVTVLTTAGVIVGIVIAVHIGWL